MPKVTLEANYVGTAGHKLFRAQNTNRIAGGRLPAGACVTDNLGRNLCSAGTIENPPDVLNPNFGSSGSGRTSSTRTTTPCSCLSKNRRLEGCRLMSTTPGVTPLTMGPPGTAAAPVPTERARERVTRRMQPLPGLDRGNSIFDIRQRLVANYVLELPWYKSQQGFIGHVLGGWQYNGIVSWQTGAHWEPWSSAQRVLTDFTDPANPVPGCTAATVAAGNCRNTGGDYNLDGQKNDRPNALRQLQPEPRLSGPTAGVASSLQAGGFFTAPCLGRVGDLGRNTFVGPAFTCLGHFAVQEHQGYGESRYGVSCGSVQRAQPHQLPTAGRTQRNQQQYQP